MRRPLALFALSLSSLASIACGGSEDATPPAAQPGKGGAAGSAGAGGVSGKSGAGASAGGASGAGQAGAAGGGAGQAGVAGAAGNAGSAGTAGGAGAAGSAGTAGNAGIAGSAGAAGVAGGSGAAGNAGATQGGSAGAAGQAGAAQGGNAGSGGSGDACPSQVLCGANGTCCAVGDECAEGSCRPACASNVRCGETCCQSGSVCSQGACTVPGKDCGDSFDCGENGFCEPTLGKCLPQPPGGPTCQYKPPVLPFAPQIEWAWTGSAIKPSYDQILSVPLVADVDADGTPDVVIVTHDTGDGSCDTGHAYLRALDGKTGAEKWAANVDAYTDAARVAFCRTPALADLDGDGIPEIVAPRFGGGLLAVRGDGKLLWTSTQADGTTPYTQYLTYAASVGIANVDGVGDPEIVLGGAVFDAKGKLLSGLGLQNIGGNPTLGAIALVADVDEDGKQDFVSGNAVYGSDGLAKWTIPASDGYTAIADFERDGVPELVVISSGTARVQNAKTGQILASLDMPGKGAGGPPTIADFDGDGALDFASAVGDSYTIFTYKATPTPTISVRWSVFTLDASSSRTGSSVFDFEGDGSAEVLYNDECYLRVYNGKNGDVLYQTASSSGTASQYPIAVDVDGDGNTELVVISDDKYQISGQTPGCPNYKDGEKLRHGVFVYGDSNDKWVGSRKIWNQHAYHQTNINADATVPVKEIASWGPQGSNTYRVSSQGQGVFNAPDLALDLEISTTACPTNLTLKARIKNLGSQGVPAGVTVRFHLGTDANGPLIQTAASTKPLLPGESDVVTATFTVASASAAYQFFAVVDPEAKIDECNEANNSAQAGGITCPSKD